jgi:hypothetical protein
LPSATRSQPCERRRHPDGVRWHLQHHDAEQQRDLALDNPFNFSAAVSGFAKGDTLGFGGFGGGASPPFVEEGNVVGNTPLTVVDGRHVAVLVLAGLYTSGDFNLANDDAGGLFVKHV